jgi:hypothetical protein
MSEGVKQARRLIAVVELEDVRLVEATAKAGVRSREEAGEIELSAIHSARAPQGIREGIFYVLTSLEVRITSADAEQKKQPLALRVEYELKYRVPADFKATKAEISSFAKVNGVYNAWPYFREYVQSTMLRMNLPPVILPVYRIPPTPKNEATPSSTGQAPPSGRSPGAARD